MAGKRDAEVIDFLDQWVLQDGQPITARLLSVKRRMNIGEAHRIMAEFYAQASERGPDSMPFTTWTIKGMLKDAPADSQHSSDSMDVDDEGSAPSLVKETLLLVADDKVQETERSFERVDAKEVYSFSPRLASKSQTAHKVAAISQLTTIHHDLRSTKEYVEVWESTEGGAQLGTIRAAVAWKEAGKRAAETKAGPSKPATSNMAAAAAPARPIKRESQSESKQVDKKPADKSVAGKSEGLDWSKAKASSAKAKRKLADSDNEPDEGDESMANAEDDNDEEDDSGPIGYAEESPAAQSNVAIEHGGASRKRGDEAAKVSAQEKERQRRKQELMEMMDEDDGGETEPSALAAKTAGTSTSTVFGTIEEKPEDTGMEGKSTEEIGAEDNSEPAVNPSKRRVRKQRKVIRKETTKDAKGYRRTVDVEAYESYSSDEDDTAPKPTAKKSSTKGLTEPLAKDAVPKTATAAAKKGAVSGQRKLSSFFAKG